MKKTYLKTKKGICKVTFSLPKGTNALTANLVGEFNNWDKNATPLKRKRDGTFSVSLNLAVGKEYRFRYLLNRVRWENDAHADRYDPNAFGVEDSVVST